MCVALIWRQIWQYRKCIFYFCIICRKIYYGPILMLHPFHEEVSVLDSMYTGWLSQGAVIGLTARSKVTKSGDIRKIKISSSGMLHSRTACVPTDLEPCLSFSLVSLLKESGGLVAPIHTLEEFCNFANHTLFSINVEIFSHRAFISVGKG